MALALLMQSLGCGSASSSDDAGTCALGNDAGEVATHAGIDAGTPGAADVAGDLGPGPDIDLDTKIDTIDIDTDMAGIPSRGLDGPIAALDSEPECTGWTTLLRLSPATLSALMAESDPIVIDVHTPYYGDIPGTDTSIPYDDVDAIDNYLRGDRCADVVLICESGGMSQSAGNELVKRGYLRVRDLKGGMLEWEKEGYPLLKDGGM